ncbi:uncharacterized protein [Clytia hemisphaerica]|uniref:uncharacterized protein n=1 Tax=Clytia hemisphaerica TaxID=252671 RepID=UPI0034D6777B
MVNDPYGEFLQEAYECSHCPVRTVAKKFRTLFNVSNVLVIQLVIFGFDQNTFVSKKLAPNLNVETQFDNVLLGKLHLQAIVYHHGNSANSGHYTAVVKYGETWYRVDDESVVPIPNVQSQYKVDDRSVPYLLIYKKTSGEMPTTPIENKSHSDSQYSPSPDIVSTGNEDPTSKVTHANLDVAIDNPFQSFATIKNLTSETMMRNSLLQELDRQNRKVTETRSTLDKPFTPVKRKRKLSTSSKKNAMKDVRYNMDEVKKRLFRKSDQSRKRHFRHNQDELEKKQERESVKKIMKKIRCNQDEFEKEKVRKSDQARKKNLRDNQDEFEKEKVRKSDKARKKNLRDNQDEFERKQEKESAQKRMKETRDNRDEFEKEKVRKSDKARKKNLRDNQDEFERKQEKESAQKRMKETRDNQDDFEKEKVRKSAREKMKDYRSFHRAQQQKEFGKVQNASMVDPSITLTKAFEILKQNFDSAIKEGPTNKCHICIKWEYKGNGKNFLHKEYEEFEIFEKCDISNKDCDPEKIYWICYPCDKAIKKDKLPMQAQANNLQLSPRIPELDNLCPIEMMLVSQIIPFMFIVPKHKGGQQGLKGQCVMVPANLDKIQKILPRVCSEEFLISLALKRRLTDKSYVNKQNIRPAFVTKALEKLVEINKFYENVVPNARWEDESLRRDPELWSLLTEKNAQPQQDVESDSDDNIEGNDKNHEKQIKDNNSSQPTLMYDIEGANITSEQAIEIAHKQPASVSSDEIVNIAPCENEMPVSFYSEPDWEALAFPGHYPDAKNYFNTPRDRNITPIKYVHARLKSSDDRFASDPQYIFHSLHWTESSNVASAISFSQQKHFQSDISAGSLTNPDNVRQMINDDQIFQNSFKNIRGTPQWCHNMMLDVLAKCRVFGPSTYFLTWSAALFKWTSIIKVVATQYGENLTDEEVNNMSWSEKVQYLKRNPVTVARQIDHIFNKVFPKMLMSGMHPIGQILNYDDRREFQHRTGLEHVHSQVHIKDAPKINERDSSKDNEVIDFIDKYVTCQLPDKEKYPELYHLVNTVQKHHHTFTCRKKSGSRCRFKAPWPPCEETRIIRGKYIDKNEYRQSKRILDKVLDEINNYSTDLESVTLDDLLSSCDLSRDEYFSALDIVQRKLTVIYKREPHETNIGPYNTVIISLLQSNMNIQYVTNMYAVLAYITSYMCKPERNMSELKQKAHKEASGKAVKDKLRAIGNVFLTKREVSTYEAIKRTLSLKMRTSNIDVEYIPSGPKEKRLRMLKNPSELAKLDPESKNIYKKNLIDKYAHRPNNLRDMCYADFASTYTYPKKNENEEENEVNESETETIEINAELSKTITLKNGMGKMRKRSRACVIRYHKVSKLQDRNNYYLVLLQLYMPWENEDTIKGDCATFEEKFFEVEEVIMPNILKHDSHFNQPNEIDLDEIPVYDNSDSESSSEDEQGNDYGVFHPDLIDFDQDNESNDESNENPLIPFTVTNQNPAIPRDLFYNMCSNFNEKQQNFFNYIFKYVMTLKLAEKNNSLEKPDPFRILLSGGAGVGKSFLVKALTEQLRKILKEPGQNCDTHPSVLVTASTGKAAASIDGTTLHSVLKLPIYGKGTYIINKSLSDSNMQNLRVKFKYLRILIIDEISMIGDKSFDDLNLRLQNIKENKDSFGGISLLLIGDFFQLTPVGQNSIYDPKGLRFAWDEFQLYELEEIVRQSGDSEFAELLNRLREGNHTSADIEKISSFEQTDTTEWPENFMKMYITNRLKDQQNSLCLRQCKEWGNKHTSLAKDESRTKVNLKKDMPINETAGLPKELTICVGARVMLTINKDVEDKLINGSTGIVRYIQGLRNNKPSGMILVQFDNPSSGNKLKDSRLKYEYKSCVPIYPETKTFKFNDIEITRKQFPLIVAFATTIHKAQGSTLEYASGNLDQSTRSGKGLTPVGPGLLYTLLSRATSSNNIHLLNFKPDKHIVVNNKALKAMEEMRSNKALLLTHPLERMHGPNLCLFNIRSWNMHIEHFLSQKIYTSRCCLLCFTETGRNTAKRVEDNPNLSTWKTLHKQTEHGLAITYDTNHVQIIQLLNTVSNIELLPSLIMVNGEYILLVLIYRPPASSIPLFIQSLQIELDQIGQQIDVATYSTVILGDFNLPVNRNDLNELLPPHIFHQRCHYPTHIDGNILDLIFQNNCSDAAGWMPSPFSDHFAIFVNLIPYS